MDENVLDIYQNLDSEHGIFYSHLQNRCNRTVIPYTAHTQKETEVQEKKKTWQ